LERQLHDSDDITSDPHLGEHIMQVLNRLDNSVHVASIHLRTGEVTAAELILDPKLPERRTMGPVEAAISLELLQATREEAQKLNQAGYTVQTSGAATRRLAKLANVLRDARLHSPARQYPMVPKTGRYNG
jgi:hypothetical protein